MAKHQNPDNGDAAIAREREAAQAEEAAREARADARRQTGATR